MLEWRKMDPAEKASYVLKLNILKTLKRICKGAKSCSEKGCKHRDKSDLGNGFRNILVDFNNTQLKEKLISWAEESGFSVMECSGPDIIALPYLVAIIDRSHYSDSSWQDYMEFFDFAVNGLTPEEIEECGLEDVEFDDGFMAPLIIFNRSIIIDDPPNARFIYLNESDFERIKKIILATYKKQ